jgi:Type II secretion system (T2SS), protein M
MTARDRMVLIVLGGLAVLAAVWLLAVSPERERAAKLATEVSAAQAQLATAESQVADASAAQAQYQTAYASIVRLGKAVPAGQEVPSLIYQLEQASNQKNVEFASITAGAGAAGAAGTSGTASGAAASSSAAGGASTTAGTSAAASAGFTQMPFTFVFNGDFFGLYDLFQQLNRFTLRTTSGGLRVSGRLLTIQSVKLARSNDSSGGGAQGSGNAGGSELLSGTITATAYVLPAGQSLTGGATPAGPAGAGTQTASTGASSSPNAPAIVRVNP